MTLPIWKRGLGQRLAKTKPEGMSDEKWSDELGIKRAAWSSYVAEKTSPRLELLLLIKSIRGIDLEWLATGKGTMFGESPLSEEQWQAVTEAITATVKSEMPLAAKVMGIMGYLHGLLDAPRKTDNIPTPTPREEPANDRGTVRKRNKAGHA